MPYKELHGNLFASKAHAIVNTVNCVGFMGKGVALEFRRRFPAMFAEYKKVCLEKRLRPGQILPYRKSSPWILNFAIKDDWKNPSREEWVEECLNKFRASYRAMGIQSVAFPWMGAMNGRIPLTTIQELTRRYLSDLGDIDVEVYSFDPSATDPLFETLKERMKCLSAESFARESGLQLRFAEAVYDLVGTGEAKSIAEVVGSSRLGDTSLDHLYAYLAAPRPAESGEPRELF
jgi:O-acetyl-ADP-ribose deacetylase (regulator of RNase III)